MPTPQENGQLVLDIYAHFKSRAGHVLLANNFVSVAARRHIPIGDIQDGLRYAVEQNWVEKSPNGLRLTPDGHATLMRQQTV